MSTIAGRSSLVPGPIATDSGSADECALVPWFMSQVYSQRSRKLDTTTQRAAWRKLAMLDAAETLGDLRVPLGNRPDNQPAVADLLPLGRSRAGKLLRSFTRRSPD